MENWIKRCSEAYFQADCIKIHENLFFLSVQVKFDEIVCSSIQLKSIKPKHPGSVEQRTPFAYY